MGPFIKHSLSVVFHKLIMNAAAAPYHGPLPDLRKNQSSHELQLLYQS
jgi:hypothetical protein